VPDVASLASFVAFQAFWLVAVGGAARGLPWVGLLALPVLLAVHARLVPAPERGRELAFVVAVGVLGAALDSALKGLAITRYPSSEGVWTVPVVPPFIAALWAGFATLPRFSLRWLADRPALAALLGAVGGPLSFAAGARMGAVGVGPTPALTWGVLALEYALATPLLLWLAPGVQPAVRALRARTELPG
jgi:hypothetical protein